MVLVLGALLVETRRRRAGLPVLALLGVAGLLRPEAWLLSGAYVVWLVVDTNPAHPERDPRRVAVLVGAAALAPVLWLLSDWAMTGDPLHSLTGTRDTAATLGRITGIGEVPLTAPRRVGEILREPVLLGAGIGLVLAWLWLRDRVRLASRQAFALAAFCVLPRPACRSRRYLLLPSAIGAILCGTGAFGWLTRPHQPFRRRRIWMWLGVFVLLVQLPFIRQSTGSTRSPRADDQDGVQDDLRRRPRRRLRRAVRHRHDAQPRPSPLLWLDPRRRHPQRAGRTVPLGTTCSPPASPRPTFLDRGMPARCCRRHQATGWRRPTPHGGCKHCAPAAVTLGASEDGPCTRRCGRLVGRTHTDGSGTGTPTNACRYSLKAASFGLT